MAKSQAVTIAEMKKDIEYIKKGQKEMHDTMKDFIEAVNLRVDEQDKRFAGKWVEKIAVGVLTALIIATITLVVTQ